MEILRERVKRKFILRVFGVILREMLLHSLSAADSSTFRNGNVRHIGIISFTLAFPFEILRPWKAKPERKSRLLKPCETRRPSGLWRECRLRMFRSNPTSNLISASTCFPGQIRSSVGGSKSAFSPRVLEEIRPWIRRLKSLRPDVAVAVIAPQLSVQAQAFCIENGIDFLDLAGNVSINIPGKVYAAKKRHAGKR